MSAPVGLRLLSAAARLPAVLLPPAVAIGVAGDYRPVVAAAAVVAALCGTVVGSRVAVLAAARFSVRSVAVSTAAVHVVVLVLLITAAGHTAAPVVLILFSFAAGASAPPEHAVDPHRRLDRTVFFLAAVVAVGFALAFEGTGLLVASAVLTALAVPALEMVRDSEDHLPVHPIALLSAAEALWWGAGVVLIVVFSAVAELVEARWTVGLVVVSLISCRVAAPSWSARAPRRAASGPH